jgi:hypothetical protein
MGNSLQNEELGNLYSSYDITKVPKSRSYNELNKNAGMEETRNAYKSFDGELLGKQPFRRPSTFHI